MEKEYKLQKGEVYSNFALVHNYKLSKKYLMRFSLVTAGIVLTQVLIGHEGSFYLAAPLAVISSTQTINEFKKYKKYCKTYKEASNYLDNITSELILLGYDLKQDALQNAENYENNSIRFKDNHDNKYLLYEDEQLNYFIKADFKDADCSQNVTKQIIKGLSKSKQNK